MSGEVRSPREQVDDAIAQMDVYAANYGLLPPAPQALRISEYLALSPEDYEDMTTEEIGRMAVDISGYVVHVAAFVGSLKARVEFCKRKILKMTEGALDGYDRYMKHEDKRLAATVANKAAMEYYEIQKNCESFIQRWSDYSYRLESLAKSMQNLCYSKGR